MFCAHYGTDEIFLLAIQFFIKWDAKIEDVELFH
jgi:hypothetical protein